MTSSALNILCVLAMSMLAAQAHAAKLEDIAPYPQAEKSGLTSATRAHWFDLLLPKK